MSLDCIIVGYNELPMDRIQADYVSMKEASGALRFLKHNTVLFRDKRLHYMQLLNAALMEAGSPDPGLHVMKLPSLAVGYLKSYLARRGFDVGIVNFFNTGRDEMMKMLQQSPRIVAITTTFYVESAPIIDLVRFIRNQTSDPLIVIGGPHILDILNRADVETQDYLLEEIGADVYVHDSQGEATLARLLFELKQKQNPDLTVIPNLVVRSELVPDTETDSLFVRTGRELENNDMNENAVDWRFLPTEFYVPSTQMRTARSCAFECAFCRYPVIAGALNLTDLAIVEKEMRQLQESGVRNLIIIDDTFNVPFPRFKKLLRMMIANKFDFNWFSYFRCSNSDEEAFDLMAQSGCKGTFLGIESGDPQILLNMNKHATVEKYRDGIRQLNERGITTFASLIVGFPGETRDSIQRTMEFLEDSRPRFFFPELYYHAETLPIQERAGEFGLRSAGFSWRHNTMDWRDAADAIDEMILNVTGSTLLPVYMFSFWSLPYFLGHGISLDDVARFTAAAGRLLKSSLKGESQDQANLEETVVSVARTIVGNSTISSH